MGSSCSRCFTGCSQGLGCVVVISRLKREDYYPAHSPGPLHRTASRLGRLCSLEVRDPRQKKRGPPGGGHSLFVT